MSHSLAAVWPVMGMSSAVIFRTIFSPWVAEIRHWHSSSLSGVGECENKPIDSCRVRPQTEIDKTENFEPWHVLFNNETFWQV